MLSGRLVAGGQRLVGEQDAWGLPSPGAVMVSSRGEGVSLPGLSQPHLTMPRGPVLCAWASVSVKAQRPSEPLSPTKGFGLESTATF